MPLVLCKLLLPARADLSDNLIGTQTCEFCLLVKEGYAKLQVRNASAIVVHDRPTASFEKLPTKIVLV